jgi:hypothetical protein
MSGYNEYEKEGLGFEVFFFKCYKDIGIHINTQIHRQRARKGERKTYWIECRWFLRNGGSFSICKNTNTQNTKTTTKKA